MQEHEAHLASRWDEAKDIVGIRVVPKEPFRYEPGHVVLLRAEGASDGYFAIASAPGEDAPPSFLLKRGGRAADALLEMEDGGQVWLKGPMGPGFPLEDCRGGDLVFVGVGTGIAPLRSALVEALRSRDDFKRLVLVYGALDREHFCCLESLDAWREAGVEVLLTASHEPEDGDWDGARGFVQEHLDGLKLDTKKVTAFIAGMPAMEEAVRETFAELGVPADRVRSNY